MGTSIVLWRGLAWDERRTIDITFFLKLLGDGMQSKQLYEFCVENKCSENFQCKAICGLWGFLIYKGTENKEKDEARLNVKRIECCSPRKGVCFGFFSFHWKISSGSVGSKSISVFCLCHRDPFFPLKKKKATTTKLKHKQPISHTHTIFHFCIRLNMLTQSYYWGEQKPNPHPFLKARTFLAFQLVKSLIYVILNQSPWY